MKKVINLLLILLMLFSLVACKEANENEDSTPIDNNEDENDSNEEENYKLVIKNKSVTIGIGETVEIELDTDIEDIKTISYKNTDNSIVSFTKDGKLKGMKAGTVTITAKCGDISDTMIVTVTDEVKVYEKTDYRYWLNIIKEKEDVEEVLMSDSDIEKFNNTVYSDYSKTKVYDLSKLSLTISGSEVKQLIEGYNKIEKYTMYKSTGVQISATEKNEVLQNRNLDNIPTTITASYGVIVNFGSMKGYPTNNYLRASDFDYNQETGVVVGETLLIYHYSKDGKWCFVQTENYNGWIEVDNVAKCTKDEFLTYYKNEHYMVVIGERIDVEGTILRMGDKIPYKSVNDNEFICLMPKKCNDETLCITEVKVENNELVNDGYLKFNYTNLFKQGFKLLNTNYRWGDLDIDGRDCSSTQNAIYHCFGFVMPRNTSNQRLVPNYSTEVNGLTDSTIRKYKIGTLIYTSSHVMMYIGEDAEGNSYLLHNSGYCKLQTLASYNSSVSKGMIGTLTIR